MLAYIITDGISVNEELVRNGLARAFIIKLNEKYAGRILEAEREAKLARKGIWVISRSITRHRKIEGFS